ncbi:MAG: class I SAM-dependent methyltransferase [Acidobacteriota bacterium]
MSSEQFFDQVAKDWDKMRVNFYSDNVREKAFAVAGVVTGRLAADIGAGTGFITTGLLQHGLKVIAVDRSEAMLVEMQRKFAGSGEIDYRLGEAEELPIGNEEVDYVFANMYLHHVETPLDAIHEMVRILKPKGRLTITDADEHQFEFLRIEHHDRWLGFKREDVKNWFIAAGLHNVVVDYIGENCTVPSQTSVDQACISIFVASGEK